MSAPKKRYLGDSVYAAVDGRRIVLTTENGQGPGNTIILEPEICVALVEFMRDTYGKPDKGEGFPE